MNEHQNVNQDSQEDKDNLPFLGFQNTLSIAIRNFRENMERNIKTINSVVKNINVSEWAKTLSDFGNKIPNWLKAIEHVEEEIRATIDLLEKHGWVISYDLSLNLLIDIIDDTAEKNEEQIQNYLDDLFIKEYEEQYESKKDFIFSYYQADEGYLTLSKQIFDAFEREHYLIMVSPLFQILERTIYQIAEPFNENDKRFKNSHIAIEKLKQHVGNNIEEDWRYATDISALRFIEKYFEGTRNWEGREGNNRNWITHGYDDLNEIGKRDVLQILTSIASLIHLSTFIEKEGEQSAE